MKYPMNVGSIKVLFVHQRKFYVFSVLINIRRVYSSRQQYRVYKMKVSIVRY
jgi:hypothetical protein